LNVAAERDLDSPRATYHKVPMIDMTPIPVEQMKEAVDWIRDQIPNHTVMVFCNSGVGRSPSVVIGYLCCVLGYGFGEAVEFVARKETDISILPNLIRTIENIKVESAG
jgi:protein-tyrosine phosphatase